MIRGAIFDLDGVVLDSMGVWRDLGARYLARLGAKPEEGLADKLFSMSMEQGAAYLKERYNLAGSVAEIVGGIGRLVEDFYFHEVRAKPGVGRLMEVFAQAGVQMVAATSSPREHVRRALERNGLLGYLSAIYTTGEVGKSKHSPDIFDLAARGMGWLGFAPGEVVVFEDSLYALETAKAAGYWTVGVFDADGERDQEGMRRTADVYLARAEFAEFAERFGSGTLPWAAGDNVPARRGEPNGEER